MNRFVWIAGGIAIVIVIVVIAGLSVVLMPGAWKEPELASGYHGIVPAETLLRVPVRDGTRAAIHSCQPGRSCGISQPHT